MKKDIFKTLKDYSAGYHRVSTPEENKIYDAEVERVKTRILADVEHSPEIIAEEFSKLWATEYRRLFSGVYSTFAMTPEYKAVDNIYMALLDSKPLKGITVTQCNADKREQKMTGITLQELENKIVEDKTVENLNRLAQNMESLNNNATIDNATKIHCLEQKLGEYHGFFKVLVLLNQDKAVKLSVKHRDILAKATDFNAKIYHLGEQQ